MNSNAVLGDYSLEDYAAYMLSIGEPAYRAKQLFQGISQGIAIEEMSNLPKAVRAQIKEDFFAPPVIVKTYPSKDGSSKFLYRLHDGNLIEGVYMPHVYGVSLCISTQVGCRMRCAFCASGIDGLARNLTPGEMLGQITAANKLTAATVTNIVLMGSGEPLDNFENVVRFLTLVTDESGLNISRRNISLSTCGLPDRICELADSNPGVTLSISLHATTDEKRSAMMPVNNAYNLDELMKACKYYIEKTNKRISFEYALAKDNNDNLEDAKKLVQLLKGMICHVNLIPINKIENG